MTQDQINQIIEGLENTNTRLEATHITSLCVTNVIVKLKNGDYKCKSGGNVIKGQETKTKKQITEILNDSSRHSFELVTKVLTETRVKI